MSIPKTVGLPKIKKEKNEKRVFLPEFVQLLVGLGAEIYIEIDYGRELGLSFNDFCKHSLSVHQCSREEAFQKDTMLVLRAPEREEFDMLKRGSILISMLHYKTRPWRVSRLEELGIKAISLDSIVDDNNLRLVEDMRAVAWNGLDTAFSVIEKYNPTFSRSDGLPYTTLILGTGIVGKYAVDAATKLGNVERNERIMREDGSGSIALVVGRNNSNKPEVMQRLIKQADILVDATRRRNPSLAVIPNDWISWLPEHAVIIDLAVDPYLLNDDPPVVRGIEGIPRGNLDKYVFTPVDPDWERTIPPQIPKNHRRTVVSCYSWPGIFPEECMKHYARQLSPLMEVLFQKGYEGLSLEGGYFERALCHATLHEWLKTKKV